MILTEDEARTKWCPMARYMQSAVQEDNGRFIVVAVNREEQQIFHGRGLGEPSNHNPTGARCIASDCMMWRWHWKLIPPSEEAMLEAASVPDPLPPQPKYERTDKGYCGLANG